MDKEKQIFKLTDNSSYRLEAGMDSEGHLIEVSLVSNVNPHLGQPLWKAPNADFEYLRSKIRTMRPGDPLQKLLKEELTALHHWKALPRGNPQAGFKKSQEKK